ncbi:MAG: UDP-N-acetylmuramate dehydrogenase [Chloroflexi bacterium]|nr:UDP-N-acetylmuramate dehydrogenase [Chloroflexota bacterium]MCC6896692.1 UDP-N-acetylmuramate dehydrogenase [Anaerolineae bacterium]
MTLKLPEPYASRIKYSEPLGRHTAARIGGAAEMLYIAKESNDELATVAMAAWEQNVPVRVLGGGANVLISDKGVRGLVLINDVNEVTFGDWHDGRNVAASGGAGLTVLARKCQTRGLSGLEWAASVPGTVGGSVVNNAGAHGSDIRANLCEAVILEAEHGIHIFTLDDLTYGYRTSILKARTDKRFLVLMAQFALKPDDPQAILERMEHHVAYRKETQPPGASLGSIFKNPVGDYAGRLIEAAGLKGYSIGGAQVSPVHGNFLINKDGASAADYYALVNHVRDQVYKHSGVRLEMEIEMLGEW